MPGSRIHPAAAGGFERAVAEYERGRPGYPREAVEFVVGALALAPGARILDLAAGSGKFTRELVAHGAAVVAVEPVRAMRETLARTLRGVEALDGTAEAIPLADGSVDAVTVAQAFHWFDGERALSEIHRVLRPGGKLALIWNRRDERSELQRRLSEIVHPYRGDTPAYGSGVWRKSFETTRLFTRLAERHFPHAVEASADVLVARIASISFIAALPAPEREQVLERVRDLGAAVLAYETDVFWCARV